MARWVERILLATGVAALGYAAWAVIEARVVQRSESAAFDSALARKLPPPAGVIGRLEIPRVGISVLVLEGDDPDILSVAAGHIPGTSLPGEPGNTAIAAHRDSFFRPLRHIRRGDAIRLVTTRKTYTYLVDSISIVPPADVGVLGDSHATELTLVTCYPFYYIGSAPQRFIVQARPEAAPALTRAAPAGHSG